MDTALDSGGRVTRALRKRLTSIDSDNGSSRPGTPVQSKLASGPTNSPMKTRMTRRHSTSGLGTPIKTPGKRAANAVAVIVEEENITPARRTTRRRSVSQIENEGTPKYENKLPNIESLSEETPDARVTRSKSKSPEQPKSVSRSRKSMRSKEEENATIEEQKEEQSSPITTSSKRKTRSTENTMEAEVQNKSNVEKQIKSSSPSSKLKSSTSYNDDENNGIMQSPKNSSRRISLNVIKSIDPKVQIEDEVRDKKRKSLSRNDEKKDSNNTVNGQEIHGSEMQIEDNISSLLTDKLCSNVEDEELFEKMEVEEDNDNEQVDSKNQKNLKIDGAKLHDKKEKNLNVSLSKNNTLSLQAQESEAGNEEIPKNSSMSDRETIANMETNSNSNIKSPMINEAKLDDKKPKHLKVSLSRKISWPMQTQLSQTGKEGNSKNSSVSDTDNSNIANNSNLNNESPKVNEGNFTKEFNNNVVEKNTAILEKNVFLDLLKEEPMDECVIENTEEKKNEALHEEHTKNNESIKFLHIEENVNVMTPDRNSSVMKPTNGAESLKKVVFSVVVSDDECEKSMYPKTPASAKSKSLTENKDTSDFDTSYQGAENESVILINDTTGIEIPETQQEVTVHKTITEDTVASIEDDNKTDKAKEANLSHSKESRADLPADDSDVEVTVNEHVNLKWCNPSVVAKGNKLDTIINKEEEGLSMSTPLDEKKCSNQKDKKIFLKRAEWKDVGDEERASDDDYLEEGGEEEDGEDDFKRKHPFHDDEAMEVDDDYQSGDSMDSEERREIMENEVPIDGESIGSHTSDEEENEDEESETDSFIVSDNCEEDENVHSGYSDFDEEVYKESKESEDLEDKKKTFKRIRKVSYTSSSNEDEDVEHAENNKSLQNNNLKNSCQQLREESEQENETSIQEVKDLNAFTKNISVAKDINETIEIVANEKLENKSLNSSRLSDSAKRLNKNNSKEKSDDSNEENEENNIDKSRNEILSILNKSDKFNKSVRDLNTDIDVSSDALGTSNNKDTSCGSTQMLDSKNNKTSDFEPDEEEPTSTFRNESASIMSDKKKNKKRSLVSSKPSESCLGEVSVTSEEYNENGNSVDSDSDDEKENEKIENPSQKRLKCQGLSVSFGNVNHQKDKNTPLQKKILQRSFTIGVTLNGGELETEVIESKAKKSKVTTTALSSPSASLSSNEDTDGDVLSSDDVRYLENIKHIPLGNPLVRTRRQSLALPTNPDMEIGAAVKGSTKKNKRKSLGILLGNDFQPSQSFVDSLEFRRAELERQTSKRKRLSKSFSGTAADSSVIDIDVQHLHKRSKLALNTSFAESFENTKPDNSLCLKVVGHSSTPHEKGASKKLNNSGIRRILNRCDEILEAANRAKLEAKINYRKSKIRVPKKNKKRMQQQQSISPDTKREKVLAPLSKEIKKRDKTKIAVTQALKASVNLIGGKQRKQMVDVDCTTSKRLSPEFLKTVAVSTQSTTAKKNKKEQNKEKELECMNYSTAAGNVIEMLQSPQKKKKAKIIRLPTGNVCVEPLTPMKRKIPTCKGMEFYESPLTPCANGFRVHDLPLGNDDYCLKDRKRKRNNEVIVRKIKMPTPHWTQSGLFMEEEIPCARPPSSFSPDRTTKRSYLGNLHSNNANFKQSSLHRSDIKRSSAREILQLRDRRQVNGQRY